MKSGRLYDFNSRKLVSSLCADEHTSSKDFREQPRNPGCAASGFHRATDNDDGTPDLLPASARR